MHQKRIAVLIEGDIYHIRGEFTAVHSRLSEIAKNRNDIKADCFVVGSYYGPIVRLIKRYPKTDRPSVFVLEGIEYKCIWYKRSIVDYLCHKFFHWETSVELNRILRSVRKLGRYDLFWANALKTGFACNLLKNEYNIPLVVSWHGSSIHTDPFDDKRRFVLTKTLIEQADYNFFVSRELISTVQNLISSAFTGQVTYNGIDTLQFHPDESERQTVKNIAFVGNHLPVKNIEYLPELFSRIHEAIPNTEFHIIGSWEFEKDFSGSVYPVSFHFDIGRDEMAALYRKMDLVVMPSRNEGLPMTCLEAVGSGCQFVGSRVGAIADVVGIENTVETGEKFNEHFASLCIERINHPRPVNLPDNFILSNIVDIEINIVNNLMNG